MYGMIHRAIRQMVIETAGPGVWDDLERRLGLGPADMISAMVYPDRQTVALLTATAEQMGLTLPEALREFGRHWVRFAASGPYAGIMDFVGQDLAGFIANLDRMHHAVRVAMPEAQVPGFTVLNEEPGANGGDGPRRLHLAYRSTRAGLEPFVEGLLEGLAARFGRVGTVTFLGHGPGGAEFLVEHSPPHSPAHHRPHRAGPPA
ncbi:heme NO-binding domain-containing protein [Novosphingobium bradum]|uniref:Heme NO-binding domain-containing protein n=1 Tax=Novosphingobium bradum TaxID=1737444 RepID=A0ABV7IXQ4_9SPHN